MLVCLCLLAACSDKPPLLPQSSYACMFLFSVDPADNLHGLLPACFTIGTTLSCAFASMQEYSAYC